jgi:oligo-1,6-glucosidase
MVFQFEHVNIDHGQGKFDVLPFDLRLLKASLGRWQTGLADTGWNSLYWNNHDQPRVVSRFGDDGAHRVDSAKLLATVLHLHRGTPYVYQGEELGMTNVPFAGVDDLRDIESLNHFAQATSLGEDGDEVMASIRLVGRDNARTPMQWTAAAHAGFTTGRPWIEANPNHVSINAAEEVADPTSVFHHYRRLISLRHTDATVAFGDFTMLLPDHPTVYAFLRSDSEHQLLVIANFGAEDTAIDVADAEAWASAEVVVRSGGSPTTVSSPLTLGCWEARVLHRPR